MGLYTAILHRESDAAMVLGFQFIVNALRADIYWRPAPCPVLSLRNGKQTKVPLTQAQISSDDIICD